jgi:hypothetical protein
LNSGLCTYKADTLPLETHLRSTLSTKNSLQQSCTARKGGHSRGLHSSLLPPSPSQYGPPRPLNKNYQPIPAQPVLLNFLQSSDHQPPNNLFCSLLMHLLLIGGRQSLSGQDFNPALC